MVLQHNIYFELASAQLFPTLASTTTSVTGSDALGLASDALTQYLSGELHAAVDTYSAAISKYPDQAFFYACRSIVNEELGDGEGGFYDYQAAKGLDFNYHTFIEWLENKPVSSSRSKYTTLKEASSEALEAVQRFDYASALALYTAAIKQSPEEVDLLVYRGSLYLRLVHYNLALEDFNKALAMDSVHYQAYLSRAKLYLAIRERDAALADFAQAIALEPENSLGYEERGNFLIEQGFYTEALRDFSKLVNLLPEDFYVFALRADLFEKMEDWSSALYDYDKAITFNPYYADLYAYRADIKEKLGDTDGALADRLAFERIEADED